MESEIVPASSEEEQDLEEAEIAPASSEEEKEKREAVQTNEVFNGVLKLQELHGRIVERLQDRVKDDLARRILEFVEEELLVITESLTSTPTPPPFQEHLVGGKTMSWSWLLQLKFSAEQTNYFLKLSAPQRRILLQRRAARCFRPSSSACLDRILLAVRDFYHFAEHTCRYKHLHLSTSDDLGSPPAPCAAETAGLHLVGVDRQRIKLLRWLTSPSKRLRVILMLGPVGVGKTTLAMEVYRLAQDQTSDERYCFQASRGPTRNELLLRDILSKISDAATPELVSSDQSQTTTLETLVQHISERLRHKRYLILIDDMLQASDWEKIKGAFSDNKLGSRILITARFGRKAWSSCSYSDVLVHEMKPLNQVDSARLLLTKAFGSVDNGLSDYVKQFFYEIVRRCEGIPLFINGMADWLREQTKSEDHVTPRILMTFEGRPLSINGIPLFGDEKEREEREERPAIHSEQQVPQLPTRRFEQALSPSYDDLPCELRLLLLYMSMFPCGYKFEKDRLIKKLFYEGLTPEMLFGNFGYPEDAEGLFSQLVDSNVVTQSQLVDKTAITRAEANCKGNPDEGEDCRWQVRHFMQQFLASKSAEMGCFTSATLDLAAAEETDHGDKITTKPRRLALHDSHPQLLELLKDIDLSRIRSLAVSGAVNDGIPLYRFVNLVVLDLEGWENLKDEDLLQICRSKMIFLSYLSVRYTRVSKLPPEIRELWNLRLLDVSYTEISELPFQVFELTVLKELDLRGTRIRQLPKQIVGLQASLHALLVGGRGMISPTESTTRLPEEIGRWKYLETLATVDLREHPESFLKALGELKNLRVLAITWSFHQGTDGAYGKALVSSIQKWRKLKSLTIHCGLGCSMEFLGSLPVQESRGLEKFKVTAGRFASVPKWIKWTIHISFIQITVCRLGTEDLEILRNLRKLQCLILGLDFIPGEAIVIEAAGFPELRRFSVDCPVAWLTFRAKAMQRLTYLHLKLCSGPANQECSIWYHQPRNAHRGSPQLQQMVQRQL